MTLTQQYEQWYESSRTASGREDLVNQMHEASHPITSLSTAVQAMLTFLHLDKQDHDPKHDQEHNTSSSNHTTTDPLLLSPLTMTKLLMTLRNCCAASNNDVFLQDALEFHVLQTLFAMCRHFSLFLETNGDSEGQMSKLILALCQCLANLSSISVQAVNHVMLHHDAQLSNVIACAMRASILQRAKALSASMTLIYNCICSSKEGFEERFSRLLRTDAAGKHVNRILFCQLMLSIYPSLSPNQDSNSPNSSTAAEEPHLEWVNLLLMEWICQDRIADIYRMLAPTNSNDIAISEENHKDDEHHALVTVEQLTLLYSVLNLLEHNTTALAEHIQSFFSSSMKNKILLHDCLLTLVEVFHHVQDMATSSLSPLQSYYHTIYMDFVLICLQLFAFLISQCNNLMEDKKRQGLVESKLELEQYKVEVGVDMGAVAAMGSLLAGSTLVTNPVKDTPNVNNHISTASTETAELKFHREVVKLSLQCICNTVYRSTAGQDLLLHTGILNHVLSHCATNFSNPLTREWALLTVRNACEGNEKIQTYIDSLTLQETLDLRQQGMKIEIDGKRGKFKFVQTTTEVSASSTQPPEI